MTRIPLTISDDFGIFFTINSHFDNYLSHNLGRKTKWIEKYLHIVTRILLTMSGANTNESLVADFVVNNVTLIEEAY